MKNKIQSMFVRGLQKALNHDNGPRLPRHWKVIASTLLLLFTMGIGQMWGAVGTSASTTFTCGTTSTSGVSYAFTYDSNGANSDTIIFHAASLYSSSATYAYYSGSAPATSSQDFAPRIYNAVNGTSLSSSKGIYSASGSSNPSELRVQSGKILWVKVTNCTSVLLSGKSGGSRTTNLDVYLASNTSTPITNGSKTIANTANTVEVTGMSASNTYLIKISGSTSSNCAVYELALVYPHASTGPSISSFSPATGATVKSGTTVTVTGSTGSTIYYKWATSTQTADDIYNGGSGSHGTADAATVTSSGINSANGTTLYAIARKGTTNSAVASASYTIDDDGPELVSSVPANSATNVATSGTIVLTFDEEINALDDSKFSLDNATLGTVAIDGTDATKVNVAYSGAANSATVTLSVQAEAVGDALGNKSAALSDISFTTVAAGPTTPTLTYNDGVYTIGGSDLDLSTLIETKQSNGTITYSVKTDGDTDASIVGVNFSATAAGTATITASQAADGETYLATTAEFDVVVSAAAPAPTPCATLTPATSGASPTAIGQEALLQEGSTGGRIVFASYKTSSGNTIDQSFTYTSRGLQLNKGGDDKIRVELNHLIQEGTVITVNMNWSRDDGKASGLVLRSGDDATAVKTMTMVDPSGAFSDSYEVQSTDTKLIGNNSFILARSNSVGLTSVTVSNCGDPLYALSSAVTPAHDPAYATITLSKTLIAAGGTATATYSAIDPAYDFDEWVVSGATIDDAKANPVTITMGSTDATITLKLKAAEVKKTVTYYDNTTELGTELVVVGENPTATGIVAPHKLGYSFAGWSTTNGGAVAALNTIVVADDMPLYAVWNAVNCATKSGTIYTMSISVAPAANCTITSTTGTHDLYQYEGVSGGEALLGNKGTSNNCILQTNKKILLKDDNSYIKLDFDCPLKEGDKIVYSVESNNPVVSTGNSKPSTPLATLDRSKTEFVIPAESGLIDAQTIYIWKGGGNTTVTYINIVRPEKFAVTFNMHGHGDQVAQQDILEGGKVSEPATTDITGWDFGGWYKTYVADPESYSNPWDFDKDVVEAATVLHAKWTAHVASNDVALGTLSVNGEAITIVPSQLVYAVELPFGTTAVPAVTATANDENVKAFTITQALAVDGSATIYVKAEDNTTEATYTINFSVATSKDIQLVFKTGTTPCVGSASTATQILSNNAAVSTYINQITFTNVEGAGDDGAEGGSLNVGKKAGNMFTLSAKAGYAFQAMNFLAKIQDATCEYSINGGAWTELASTSTSDDECYAPFTSGTVHEFRLRSTGASGVWIRNMQLTIVEACTPIVVAWDEEPVEFEVGKAGYAIAATANNGGTIAYSSTDDAIVDVVAATGELTISGLGSAILKAATAEGDGTTYCANGGNDIEISKAVNTYYLVKFDAQNGDAADEVKYYDGDAAIALPADPTFAGYDFQGWFDAETGGNEITSAITPTASMMVYAQWVAQCAGATIDLQPTGASYLTGRTATALVCEATAGNGGALTYEWFTCDDEYKANPVAATAMPSTAVAGTFYYFCKVTEAGCDVEAFSDVVAITVADKDAICLVKAELAPGSSAASITSTSGYYKDDENIAINIKKDLKLGSTGNYVKVAIDGANFQDGDVVEITLASDKTASAWLQIFTDEGTTMVAEMTSGVSREHPNYLTISGVPANTKTLYLYRTEAADGNMNPYPTSMAVYRTCAPILNKVTVAGVDGTPDNTNHIAIEVPFSTLDAALDAIAYDWVSNDAAWTAAHNPAVANAWEWGVENTVTLTDKDNDQSVYYVTISKAVASTDATLSALTVNGQAIALADGVFEYNFELPYGTTVAPAVVATPNHVAAVATVDPCTVSGATITVVPESGVGDQQIYTLTFTISAWKEVVIWDGSNMTELATSPGDLGMAWATTGFGSISNYNTTCGEKSYTKVLPSGGAATSKYMTLTVPAGYVAKFYVVMASHSDGSERGMFIGSNLVKNPDATSVLELSNNDRDVAVAGMSEIVGAGTWYINPNNSIDFQEIRAYLRKGMVRNSMLGDGVLGTSCVDHNVAIEDIQGATFYELMGRDYTNYGKLAFDEIVSGELEAGVPYVFQAHGDKLILFYGEDVESAPVDKGNGMYGTFEQIVLNELDDVYYFAQRALWSCDGAETLTVAANRAYVKLSEIGEVPSSNPAPGRRRITMNVNGEKIVTGMENLNASEQPVKLLINGQIFIIRGEKMFDATGKLVK